MPAAVAGPGTPLIPRPGLGFRCSVVAMTWARSMPGPLRALAARAVHWTTEWVADVGAIGPDDARGSASATWSTAPASIYPQGALFNEHYVQHRAPDGGRALRQHQRRDGTGPGDGDRPGGAHRRALPDRPGQPHRGALEHRAGRRHPDRPLRVHHRPEPLYLDPDEPVGRQWPVEAGVRIGSGSWLGANVVVLPGASIGEHVVVAAGAVVRGEVPDRCVAAGVPARVVRRWVPDRGWVAERDVAPA